ncbi:MAG: TIM barrel protein [Bacteroidetes bacterium]|jgi:hydroxypyruvate isomerase|nr:TIM barrel protein [Bacteroidota bacterium]
MERRNFLKQNVLAGGALFASTSLLASKANTSIAMEPVPFKLNYAIHDGMFRNTAGPDFIEQIKYAHSLGFTAIEDNGMMSRTPEMQQKIGDTLASLGMHMGVFVVNFSINDKINLTTGTQEWKDKFTASCKEAVEVAKRTNATWMTTVPGNFDRRLPMDIQTGNVIEGLRAGVEILEKNNLITVLEPLSDTPDLFLRHSDQTYAICKAINSPACKILFDMYHMQKNEGNIINNINRCWSEIGYFQIGDNPGRNEPGTGEMNYKNIFKHIHGKGYKGVLGMEHGNAGADKEGEVALVKAYRDADNF